MGWGDAYALPRGEDKVNNCEPHLDVEMQQVFEEATAELQATDWETVKSAFVMEELGLAHGAKIACPWQHPFRVTRQKLRLAFWCGR